MCSIPRSDIVASCSPVWERATLLDYLCCSMLQTCWLEFLPPTLGCRFAQITILGYPAPPDAYIIEHQQVRRCAVWRCDYTCHATKSAADCLCWLVLALQPATTGSHLNQASWTRGTDACCTHRCPAGPGVLPGCDPSLPVLRRLHRLPAGPLPGNDQLQRRRRGGLGRAVQDAAAAAPAAAVHGRGACVRLGEEPKCRQMCGCLQQCLPIRVCLPWAWKCFIVLMPLDSLLGTSITLTIGSSILVATLPSTDSFHMLYCGIKSSSLRPLHVSGYYEGKCPAGGRAVLIMLIGIAA